jgi:hypothetical protein
VGTLQNCLHITLVKAIKYIIHLCILLEPSLALPVMSSSDDDFDLTALVGRAMQPTFLSRNTEENLPFREALDAEHPDSGFYFDLETLSTPPRNRRQHSPANSEIDPSFLDAPPAYSPGTFGGSFGNSHMTQSEEAAQPPSSARAGFGSDGSFQLAVDTRDFRHSFPMDELLPLSPQMSEVSGASEYKPSAPSEAAHDSDSDFNLDDCILPSRGDSPSYESDDLRLEDVILPVKKVHREVLDYILIAPSKNPSLFSF